YIRKPTPSCGASLATQRELQRLIGDTSVLRRLEPEAFTDAVFGVPTVTDILAELEKPGRDPRHTPVHNYRCRSFATYNAACRPRLRSLPPRSARRAPTSPQLRGQRWPCLSLPLSLSSRMGSPTA